MILLSRSPLHILTTVLLRHDDQSACMLEMDGAPLRHLWTHPSLEGAFLFRCWDTCVEIDIHQQVSS